MTLMCRPIVTQLDGVCLSGADVLVEDDHGIKQFRYPSYVQHIMGDIFSLGFGPFRCLGFTYKPFKGSGVRWLY